MSQEINGFANSDPSSKSVKGRIQVSLLDDTVVAFDVEVSFRLLKAYLIELLADYKLSIALLSMINIRLLLKQRS